MVGVVETFKIDSGKKLFWYEGFDYRTHERYWWTQRDSKGNCFEIRRSSREKGNFDLFMCEKFVESYSEFQKAMNAAVKM